MSNDLTSELVTADDLAFALQTFGGLPWEDLGCHLTCDEADRAFEALTRVGMDYAAENLMADHAYADGDEDEDRHALELGDPDNGLPGFIRTPTANDTPFWQGHPANVTEDTE